MKFILVTGCPRSGTTAVGSWLSTQSGVRGVNESRRTVAIHAMMQEARRFACFYPSNGLVDNFTDPTVLREAARAAALRLYGASEDDVVVDKEPLEKIALPKEDYSAYLHDVRDVLDAKLVCMIRNPIDTVASMKKRGWGYSLRKGDVHQMSAHECIATWKRATRAVLRMSLLEPESTHIQPYEELCADPARATEVLRGVTGLPLTEFKPRESHHGEFDAQIIEWTAWDRQLLMTYDDRAKVPPQIALLTGEPGVGKTSIARSVAAALDPESKRVVVLDGDDMRRRLWPELGYDVEARAESVRRAFKLATRVASNGAVVLVSMVAPSEEARLRAGEQAARAGISFRVVRVKSPPDVRKQRSAEAKKPEKVHDVVYEEPSAPNVVIDTSTVPFNRAIEDVLTLL